MHDCTGPRVQRAFKKPSDARRKLRSHVQRHAYWPNQDRRFTHTRCPGAAAFEILRQLRRDEEISIEILEDPHRGNGFGNIVKI